MDSPIFLQAETSHSWNTIAERGTRNPEFAGGGRSDAGNIKLDDASIEAKSGHSFTRAPWIMTITSGPPSNALEGKPFRLPVIVQIKRTAGPEVALQEATFSAIATLIARGIDGQEFEAPPDLLGGKYVVDVQKNEFEDRGVIGSAVFDNLRVLRPGIFKIRIRVRALINVRTPLSRPIETVIETESFPCQPRLLGVSTGTYYGRAITISWDVPQFVRTQLDSPRDLHSVLTLSGSPDKAYATTCEEYIKLFWPEFGGTVLDTLVRALEAEPRSQVKQASGNYIRKTGDKSIFEITISVHEDYTDVQASGSGDQLHELAGLLLWIASALRIPQSGKLLSARAGLEPIDLEPENYQLVPNPLQTIKEHSGSCWHNMFSGFVLAEEFPIPDRDSQLGVELEFEIMILLGLICYPTRFGTQPILKGDRTALIPQVVSDPETVQWHFIQSNSSSISWDDIGEHCRDPDGRYDIKTLSTMRTFVGYFPRVCVNLGTRGSGFQRIDISGARYNDRTRLTRGDDISMAFGSSGLGFFGPQVTLKANLTSTAKRRIVSEHDHLLDKMRNSKEEPVLLYDVMEKRAWLVPEIYIVLHLFRAWASSQDHPESIQNLLQDPGPGIDAEGAYRAISRAKGIQLPVLVRTDKHSTLGHLFLFFSQQLHSIKDEQWNRVKVDKVKEEKHLVGYEFTDISRLRNLRSKRAAIDPQESAGWIKLVSSVPDIAVLFFRNLGEPIKLDTNHEPHCRQWASVQEGHDYLTATVRCLKYLSWNCGGGNALQIYNDLYCVGWEPDDDMQCPDRPWPCCKPLLHISSKRDPRETSYAEEGAVIIGKVVTKLRKRKAPERPVAIEPALQEPAYILAHGFDPPGRHIPQQPHMADMPVQSEVPRTVLHDGTARRFLER